MGRIALVSVGDGLTATLASAGLDPVGYVSARTLHAPGAVAAEALDAIVLGEAVDDPTHGAAHAYRLDPGLSVIVLGNDASQCDRMRAALGFAPLVGRDVTCALAGASDLVQQIGGAAARTRARRRHRLLLAAITPRQSTETPIPIATVTPARDRFADRLMELAPVAILAVDPKRRIVTANTFAERIFGKHERALLGVVLGGEALGTDGGVWTKLLDDAHEDAPTSDPVRIVRADRVLEARAVAMDMGAGSGWLVVVDDVTSRAQADQQRAIAYREAEAASRMKDEFIAVISHELRTPLNAIVGWTNMLVGGGLDPERTSHALSVISRNARAQTQLIGDLLDVSRIVSGKLRLEVGAVAIASVVTAAMDAIAPAVAARQVDVVVDVPPTLPTVLGDADRLQQVVWNLVNNAVKFSRAGGAVRISARLDGPSLELSVRDDGAGIAPELLPFVFDPFRQADGSSTRVHGGLGLGLAIVRRLVEMHGGTVGAESEGEGRGAVFTVRLPVSAPATTGADEGSVGEASRRAPAAPGEASSLAGISVLVVDDDEDARELLVTVLELAGATVHAAASVASARGLLAGMRPALVVSDLGMPDEDGYALVADVHARFGRAYPVIALTAYASAAEHARALAHGFAAHLTKPVEVDVLLATVARLAAADRARIPG